MHAEEVNIALLSCCVLRESFSIHNAAIIWLAECDHYCVFCEMMLLCWNWNCQTDAIQVAARYEIELNGGSRIGAENLYYIG